MKKRRFIASKKFPAITLLILAAVTTAAFWRMAPTGADISNGEIIHAFNLAGWATGIVTALISLIIYVILNLLGRLINVCRFGVSHGIGMIASLAPWLIMSWQITGEPRYTNIGIAIIDFIARPMLWGAMAATLFAVAVTLPWLFTKHQSCER